MSEIGGDIWINTLEVSGMYWAIMGMRNPKDSWDRSDTTPLPTRVCIGDKDMKLMQTLIKAGSEHRKFLRQIQVWANIAMPRYIWQELDTYKFGTKNSCSTMHTLFKNPITVNNFYFGKDPIVMTVNHFELDVIPKLNQFRELYLRDKDYRWIIEMKRMLPENFIQCRTWNTNYEEIRNIYHQRKNHRLEDEWGDVFVEWVESLPYAKELIIYK